MTEEQIRHFVSTAKLQGRAEGLLEAAEMSSVVSQQFLSAGDTGTSAVMAAFASALAMESRKVAAEVAAKTVGAVARKS